jgi:hypothetical protein
MGLARNGESGAVRHVRQVLSYLGVRKRYESSRMMGKRGRGRWSWWLVLMRFVKVSQPKRVGRKQMLIRTISLGVVIARPPLESCFLINPCLAFRPARTNMNISLPQSSFACCPHVDIKTGRAVATRTMKLARTFRNQFRSGIRPPPRCPQPHLCLGPLPPCAPLAQRSLSSVTPEPAETSGGLASGTGRSRNPGLVEIPGGLQAAAGLQEIHWLLLDDIGGQTVWARRVEAAIADLGATRRYRIGGELQA